MKTIISLFLILIYSTISHSQTSTPDAKISAINFIQQIVINELGLYGYSPSTYSNISNITSVNPALSANLDNLAIGFVYQFDSRLNDMWLFDLSHERIAKFIPQSFGFIIPVQDFSIGFGMSQQVNSILKFPPIPITTVEHPDGTGEFINASRNILILSYSGIVSHNWYFSKDLNFGLGFQINLDQMYFEDKLSNLKLTANGFDISGKIGLYLSLYEKHGIGFYYKKGVNVNASGELKNSELVMQNDVDPSQSGNNQIPLAVLNETWNVFAQLPDELHFGFSTYPFLKIGFSAELARVFWEDLSLSFKNHFTYSANTFYDVNSYLRVSFGFVSSRINYDKSAELFGYDAEDLEDNLQASYLLSSIHLSNNGYNIGLSIADSHLFSGDWRKQTLIKLTVTRTF